VPRSPGRPRLNHTTTHAERPAAGFPPARAVCVYAAGFRSVRAVCVYAAGFRSVRVLCVYAAGSGRCGSFACTPLAPAGARPFCVRRRLPPVRALFAYAAGFPSVRVVRLYAVGGSRRVVCLYAVRSRSCGCAPWAARGVMSVCGGPCACAWPFSVRLPRSPPDPFTHSSSAGSPVTGSGRQWGSSRRGMLRVGCGRLAPGSFARGAVAAPVGLCACVRVCRGRLGPGWVRCAGGGSGRAVCVAPWAASRVVRSEHALWPGTPAASIARRAPRGSLPDRLRAALDEA